MLPAPARKPQLIGIAKLAAEGTLLEQKRSLEYIELRSRSLLNRCTSSRMPFQWTVNPYRGCEFGCKYCYARYTHEFMELREPEDFETKIYAKNFDVRAFRAELARVKHGEEIAIGTATDPYQPAERRFGVTRRILEVFATERGHRLSLTTKSDLVARDVDLLCDVARRNVLHVNITVTTLDCELARLLEPKAPRPDLRVAAVRTLSSAGLAVGVLTMPILPLLTDSEESLDSVAAAARAAGARYLAGGVVFLKPCAMAAFLPFLEQRFPHLARRYAGRFARGAFLRGGYPAVLKERLSRIRARHNLASSPGDYRPDFWEGDPQGELFACEAATRAAGCC